MVVSIDLISPFRAGEIGPMALVEARGVFQAILRDIQHKHDVVAGVVGGFEFFKRNGKQFFADSEHTAHRHRHVLNLARLQIDYQIVNRADFLSFGVFNVGSHDFFRGERSDYQCPIVFAGPAPAWPRVEG